VAETTPATTSDKAQTGAANKERFMAAWLDSLFALIAGLAAASVFLPEQELQRAAVLICAFLAYFFVFEALLGATPGKFLFGLRVRRTDGGRCSPWQAGVRTIARVIEVNPVLFGAIPACVAILATRRHQRVGDIWAGTIVIDQETE
jgi:uncharacterized RDD family membrane protein YckC